MKLYNLEQNIDINDIFITFVKRGNAEKYYNCYTKKNCFYRLFLYNTFKKNKIKKFYQNQNFDIEYIPPESENLSYPICVKICRIFISYLIIIIVICFSLFFILLG